MTVSYKHSVTITLYVSSKLDELTMLYLKLQQGNFRILEISRGNPKQYCGYCTCETYES